MRLTADEFADALEKWPADTPIEEIEIWEFPSPNIVWWTTTRKFRFSLRRMANIKYRQRH